MSETFSILQQIDEMGRSRGVVMIFVDLSEGRAKIIGDRWQCACGCARFVHLEIRFRGR